MRQIKIAFICRREDKDVFFGVKHYLEGRGGIVIDSFFSHWTSADIDDQVESYDLIIIYGVGEMNWFVVDLKSTTRPVIYLSSMGQPEWDKDDLVVIRSQYLGYLAQIPKIIEALL